MREAWQKFGEFLLFYTGIILGSALLRRLITYWAKRLRK